MKTMGNDMSKCLDHPGNTRMCDLTLLFCRSIPLQRLSQWKPKLAAAAARIQGLKWLGVLFPGTSIPSSTSLLLDPWPTHPPSSTLWLLLRVSHLYTCSFYPAPAPAWQPPCPAPFLLKTSNHASDFLSDPPFPWKLALGPRFPWVPLF